MNLHGSDSAESVPQSRPLDRGARISRFGRKHTSIRVDADLWDWFVEWCGRNNTSTCHILEPFLFALQQSEGKIKQRVGLQTPLPKIDLTLNVTREVQRHRRREMSYGPVFNEYGTLMSCYHCSELFREGKIRRKHEPKFLVFYSPDWSQGSKVWCCGYHVRRYHRMVAKEKGFPSVIIRPIYR